MKPCVRSPGPYKTGCGTCLQSQDFRGRGKEITSSRSFPYVDSSKWMTWVEPWDPRGGKRTNSTQVTLWLPLVHHCIHKISIIIFFPNKQECQKKTTSQTPWEELMGWTSASTTSLYLFRPASPTAEAHTSDNNAVSWALLEPRTAEGATEAISPYSEGEAQRREKRLAQGHTGPARSTPQSPGSCSTASCSALGSFTALSPLGHPHLRHTWRALPFLQVQKSKRPRVSWMKGSPWEPTGDLKRNSRKWNSSKSQPFARHTGGRGHKNDDDITCFFNCLVLKLKPRPYVCILGTNNTTELPLAQDHIV